MEGKCRRADPGKGPLLLGLAVGLSLQLGYNTPPLSQGFFCFCNSLPLPHLHDLKLGFSRLKVFSTMQCRIHLVLYTSCIHDMWVGFWLTQGHHVWLQQQ